MLRYLWELIGTCLGGILDVSGTSLRDVWEISGGF